MDAHFDLGNLVTTVLLALLGFGIRQVLKRMDAQDTEIAELRRHVFNLQMFLARKLGFALRGDEEPGSRRGG